MDIEGFGEQRVQLFLRAGPLLADVGDIYSLDRAVIRGIEGFGETSVANLRDAIEASKAPAAGQPPGRAQHPPPRWRPGAGPGRRVRAAWTAVMDASVEELAAVDGVGPIIAPRVHDFFREPDNRAVVEKLRAAGVNIEGPERSACPRRWPACTVVVTGTLEGYTREETEAAIKSGAASPPAACPRRPPRSWGGTRASKLTKAETLGIPILDEAAFVHLLETGELPDLVPAVTLRSGAQQLGGLP